jgi:hypothetical protein
MYLESGTWNIILSTTCFGLYIGHHQVYLKLIERLYNLKVINASRGSIHKYENLKRKLYKCNANIYFNQQCLKKQLIPTYAKIKVPNTSHAHKYTQHKIPNLRIKAEIKCLHIKKQKLNQEIYHLHISKIV